MARNSNKKAEKIIEKEPIAVDEKAIINEEVPVKDTIEVKAPEVIVENSDGDVKTNEPSIEAPEKVEENNAQLDEKVEPKKSEKVKLKIEISFNDKYTGVDYKVGDIIPFEEKRAAELLADPRKLVSKV